MTSVTLVKAGIIGLDPDFRNEAKIPADFTGALDFLGFSIPTRILLMKSTSSLR